MYMTALPTLREKDMTVVIKIGKLGEHQKKMSLQLMTSCEKPWKYRNNVIAIYRKYFKVDYSD